jgi:curved DNA-binding protein CbpA
MEAQNFINYYEILGLSPNAGADAIDRAFRHLARQYHPDNLITGDRAKFDAISEALNTLRDPAKRAQYHDDHGDRLPPLRPPGAEESGEAGPIGGADGGDDDVVFEGLGIDRDLSIQNNILVWLYFRRRKNPREPGMGDAELERLSGCPPEHLEFHIWYLKHKGWVASGEDGLLAITIDGVDRAAQIYRESANRLLTAQS